MSPPEPLAAPGRNRPPLIELDRASVTRGQVRVLHDLSLRIDQGQHTAILGANGCGKSTLIKLITRELYPLARSEGGPPVQVLGQSRWQVDRLRSQLGIVTGDFGATLADMHALTVEDAVLSGLFASFVLPPFREITEDMRTRAAEALDRAHALPLRRRLYAELSTGEARRVLIARALVNRPQALLLDEPGTGLDLVARGHLLAMLRALARQGVTLVLVTHHIEEIVPEIERVLLLQAGRVLADGPRAAVLTGERLSQAFAGPLRVWQERDSYLATAG
ncbi:ABC transporter ATP-binding protein [Pseudoxanthomonas daejeonensis]|uniref:ABC transporter ATP-binding protein n=1 Tax=Pseudoxanthomonas daejeonensis TaxID=266062 RepID=A0ABQ6Z6T5_9GAMM|nr:ATP-binding cassette domain-containing protein [Pseudoxanthomonas daejeonensis]KAF1694426.1 ABC transporter ATP-binding protein [Pseudoxanthomonas daejeonensis]